jgi:hypothetical protein
VSTPGDEALDVLTAKMDLAALADRALGLAEHVALVVNDTGVWDQVRALQRRREVLRLSAAANWRKRPGPVTEARQVTAGNIREIAAWAGDALVYSGDRHGHTDPPWSPHECMTVSDDEGDSSAVAGDWVIRTEGGGFRALQSGDFEAEYEQVPGTQP